MYGNVCFHHILANAWLLLFHCDFYWGYVKSINQFRKNCLLYNIDSSLQGKWCASVWLHLYFISLSEVLLFSSHKSCTFITGIHSGCIIVFVVVVSFCFVMWKPLKILSSFPKCVFEALEPPDALWETQGLPVRTCSGKLVTFTWKFLWHISTSLRSPVVKKPIEHCLLLHPVHLKLIWSWNFLYVNINIFNVQSASIQWSWYSEKPSAVTWQMALIHHSSLELCPWPVTLECPSAWVWTMLRGLANGMLAKGST